MNNLKICIGNKDNYVYVEQAPDLDVILTNFAIGSEFLPEGEEGISCIIYVICRSLGFKICYDYHAISFTDNKEYDEINEQYSKIIVEQPENDDWQWDFAELELTDELFSQIKKKKANFRLAFKNMIANKLIEKDQYIDELNRIFPS